MLPTSFRPQVVQNETMQDVKGLSRISVSAFVIRQEPMRVVVVFSSRFAEKDKGPDEHAHFSWARVVPYSGDHLGESGVPEIEVFDEGHHVRRSGGFAGVRMASFGRVAKEGRIT
ncbi:unnamed protein product [Sphagnum jensenii]|uniref:Uncharacterized protein n=1 Tax=Sphagnum jensenii TaxID=128206 RepID=A0ABP1A837_9BRYO